MIFVPTYPRSFDPVHALRQSSLTLFLLSSILCFFVSSFTIDDSCQHYKGNDITGDIERALNEVKEMAHDAYVATITEAPRVDNLLATLFGNDRSRYNIVVEYFLRVSTLAPTEDIVVNCGDQRVKLEEYFGPSPVPFRVWTDHRYHWFMDVDDFEPCGSARSVADPDLFTYGYIVHERLIYLCPEILDIPFGRSLASYKDEDHTGAHIEEFISLPVLLFHEILHTFKRKPSSRR